MTPLTGPALLSILFFSHHYLVVNCTSKQCYRRKWQEKERKANGFAYYIHLNGCLSLLKHRFSDCRLELNASPPPKMSESYREQRVTCMAEPQLVLVLFSEVSRPNLKDRSNLKPEGKGLASHHPCSHAIGGDRRDVTGRGSLSNSNRSPWRPTYLEQGVSAGFTEATWAWVTLTQELAHPSDPRVSRCSANSSPAKMPRQPWTCLWGKFRQSFMTGSLKPVRSFHI